MLALDDKDLDMFALERPGESHEDSGHLPEQDLNMPDPSQQETYEVKQSTFRSNSVVWFRSSPNGRLVSFRQGIRMQQRDQRKLLQDSSRAAWLK